MDTLYKNIEVSNLEHLGLVSGLVLGLILGLVLGLVVGLVWGLICGLMLGLILYFILDLIDLRLMFVSFTLFSAKGMLGQSRIPVRQSETKKPLICLLRRVTCEENVSEGNV